MSMSSTCILSGAQRDLQAVPTGKKAEKADGVPRTALYGDALFESAHRYLEQHLSCRAPPLNSWEKERAKLLIERAALRQQYLTLKEEVREAEIVKRSVERLMSRSEPRKERTSSRGMER
jgi:hypothetical protein